MHASIKQRYNDSILEQACSRYGIDSTRVELLDGFESFIYEYPKDGSSYILRISHSLRRSFEMIQAESDWLNYLADNGVSVSRTVPSISDNHVEVIQDNKDGTFLATAFIKAEGSFKDSGNWSPELVYQLGQILGTMHALGKTYHPTHKRLHWDDPIMLEVESVLPASESAVLLKYRELISHLDGLDRSSESYGLIHQDAHAGNFLIDSNQKITLFDFDDACYGWYANDIAISLFYAVMPADDKAQFSRFFLEHLLSGYRSRNELASHWVKEIPWFLKLREIDLYAVIHRSFDLENLDDPWVENYMEGRKEKIETGVPYINFDFESMAVYL